MNTGSDDIGEDTLNRISSPCSVEIETFTIDPQLAVGLETWQQGRIKVHWIFSHFGYCVFPAAPICFHDIRILQHGFMALGQGWSETVIHPGDGLIFAVLLADLVVPGVITTRKL